VQGLLQLERRGGVGGLGVGVLVSGVGIGVVEGFLLG
jgi:hypothetical protein